MNDSAQLNSSALATESLDRIVQVTSPRAWIWLSALSLLIVLAALWGYFGRIAITVEAQGVLMRSGGVTRLKSEFDGKVIRIDVTSTSRVEKGDPLIQIETADGPQTITSPEDARILSFNVQPEMRITKGQELLLYDPVKQPLRAVVYLPSAQGYRIESGDVAQVTPAKAKQIESGYLLGRVMSTARFPASRERMVSQLPSEDMAKRLLAAGANLEVIIELKKETRGEAPLKTERVKNSYQWSSSKGTELALSSGTPCRVRFILGESSPLELVFSGSR